MKRNRLYLGMKNIYCGKLRKIEVPRYTQIGNAIPPLFGEQAGLILKELI